MTIRLCAPLHTHLHMYKYTHNAAEKYSLILMYKEKKIFNFECESQKTKIKTKYIRAMEVLTVMKTWRGTVILSVEPWRTDCIVHEPSPNTFIL